MSKIINNVTIRYEVGETVLFIHGGYITAGIITGYQIEDENDVYYNITLNQQRTFDFMHQGPIEECEIICKISNPSIRNRVFAYVKEGLEGLRTLEDDKGLKD